MSCAQPALLQVTVPAEFSTQDGAQRVGTERGQLEFGQFQAEIVSRFLYLLSKDEHKGILFVRHWLSDWPDSNTTSASSSPRDLGRLVENFADEKNRAQRHQTLSRSHTACEQRTAVLPRATDCYPDGCCESHMTQHKAATHITITAGANTDFLHTRFLLLPDVIFLEPCN